MFAPNSKHRAQVTPAGRGKGSKASSSNATEAPTPAVRIIACIEDPVVIQKILTHLANNATTLPTDRLPSVRAPPDRHH